MRIFSFCMILLFSTTVYGQQPAAAQSSPAPVAGNAQPDTSGERFRQLVRLAGDLDRAGQQSQAATVHQQAEAERKALLKRAEQLQAEVDRIRQITGGSTQVLVHLQVLEVPLTKLRSLGIDLASLRGDSTNTPSGVVKDGRGEFSAAIDDSARACMVLESLRKDNLIKVLAEPTIVTLSGCTADFHSGGQAPTTPVAKNGLTPVGPLRYGTEVQVTPQVLGDRKVRLKLNCRISELDYAHPQKVGNDSVPGVQVHECTTAAELRSGQTLVIRGLTQVRVERSEYGVPMGSSILGNKLFKKMVKEERYEVATLVVVRPEIVEPLDAPGNAAPTTANRPTDGDGRR